jgi:hypothetical protein
MRPIAPAFCILAVADMALGIEAGLAVAATLRNGTLPDEPP